ncbi:MAG TPA: efflux RND transporter periplasmic adaptor subunit [Opitutaceae bacterium]|jgi:HlyD family secretion protein|nr:efflux RND transporter periplasmic adaptor subunit [Opitutaceae bacterium]
MAKSGNSSRWIIIFFLVLLAAFGGWHYWAGRGEKAPDYYTATVARGDIVQNVTATGTIQPVLDVLVSSQISGYVDSLSADFNSKVKKDDILCTLLPTTYQAQVDSAEGDLANAQANLELQTVNVKRDQQLLDKNLIAQSDFDQAKALLDEATAQVQIKTAALKTAQTNLSYCEIKSPIDGIVIKRVVDIGNSVAATLNSPELFEIANDLTKMQIDAAVAEADIGNVAENQTVNFSVDAYPNRQFRGKVYQIRNAPQTQQNVVIYDVMINVDNSDLKLKPGMTANASIIVARRPNALLLSNGALRVRLPDNLLPPPPVAAKSADSAAAPKPMTADERRQQIHQLIQEAGFVPGNGPPSPEIIARIQQLAKERGIELPDRFKGQSSGDAVVTRTVYRLPSGNPKAKPEAVSVKLGISDGVNTEAIDGLKEGDVIITGINATVGSSSQGTSSPFGGRRLGG